MRERMSPEDLHWLKVGQTIWVARGGYSSEDLTIETVTRITATQIITSRGEWTQRYRRTKQGSLNPPGFEIGPRFLSGRIVRIATIEDVAKWEAERSALQLSTQLDGARELIPVQEEGAMDAKFDCAGSTQLRGDGYWKLELCGLTTDQIEAVAAVLKRT